ncbi:MAG: DUF1385 domain-containing protein [Lachnospiraceae bacterium]|nr:DUF1385 domain-containing protein [Lachnospiraceae bacterium]
MQKNCGIGGQALIEGIMMRNRDKYSMAARAEDGTIHTEVRDYKSIFGGGKWTKLPVIRGALSFIDSMVVGITTLMWSADVASEEADAKPLTEEEKKKEDRQWNLMMTVTVVLSLAFSVVLFMLLPYWLAGLMGKAGVNDIWVNLMEAILRIVIFMAYMFLISRMKDIQRVFSYHGAEHKCINCIEHGLPLTVENVKKSSRQHRRCGTSFLLIVIIMSVIVFLILGIFNIQSHAMRLVIRLILIPVIAGFSYELLRYAGSHEGPVINTLVKPGLALQKLVTNEPDDAMCEVAITAVEAVFDWKDWEEKNLS